MMPGKIHSVTVMPKATRVLRSATVSFPSLAFSSRTYSSTPSSSRISGLLRSAAG